MRNEVLVIWYKRFVPLISLFHGRKLRRFRDSRAAGSEFGSLNVGLYQSNQQRRGVGYLH